MADKGNSFSFYPRPSSLLAISAILALSTNAASSEPTSEWLEDEYSATSTNETYNRESTFRPFDGSRRGTFNAPRRSQQFEQPPQTIVEPVTHHWRGLYAGAQFGGSYGEAIAKYQGQATSDLSSFITGGYFGYDFAFGNVITGVEFDTTWSLGESNDAIIGTIELRPNIDWLASSRLRLGYVWNQLLIYGTVGIAYANLAYDINTNGLGQDFDETQIGYVFGGGLDFAMTSNISARLETMHYGFGNSDIQIGNDVLRTDIDLTTVRAGLTFRF